MVGFVFLSCSTGFKVFCFLGSVTPPLVLRSHKPKSSSSCLVQKPEDTFGFELIDIDELSRRASESIKPSPQNVEIDAAGTPSHNKLKSALLENGKTLIGSDNYITTVLMKNLGE